MSQTDREHLLVNLLTADQGLHQNEKIRLVHEILDGNVQASELLQKYGTPLEGTKDLDAPWSQVGRDRPPLEGNDEPLRASNNTVEFEEDIGSVDKRRSRGSRIKKHQRNSNSSKSSDRKRSKTLGSHNTSASDRLGFQVNPMVSHVPGRSESSDYSDSSDDASWSSSSSLDSYRSDSDSSREKSGSRKRRRSQRTRRRHNRNLRQESSPAPLPDSSIKIAGKMGVTKQVLEKLLGPDLANVVRPYRDDIPGAISAILEGTMHYDVLFLMCKDLSCYNSLWAMDDGGVLQFLDELRTQLVEEISKQYASSVSCVDMTTCKDLKKWSWALLNLKFGGTSVIPVVKRTECFLRQPISGNRDAVALGVFRFSGLSPNVTRSTMLIMEKILCALRPWDKIAVLDFMESWKHMIERSITASSMVSMESSLHSACQAIDTFNKFGLRDLGSTGLFRYGSWSVRSRIPSGCRRVISRETGRALRRAVKTGEASHSILKILDPVTTTLVTEDMKKAFEADGAGNVLRALHEKGNSTGATNTNVVRTWSDEEVNRASWKNVSSWPDLKAALEAENVDVHEKCLNTLCFSNGCERDTCPFASTHDSPLLSTRLRAKVFGKSGLSKPSG